MEGIRLRNMMIPSTSTCHNYSYHAFPTKTTPSLAIRPRRIRPFRFSIRAKLSDADFQDFQSYARPSRLLPASEVKVYSNIAIENIVSSLKEDTSRALFRVKLRTSNAYDSSISDFKAGILLSLIDENGNSILQRIPASSTTDPSMESGDINVTEMLHFQRGSVDEFVFEGPKIARIGALWISIESGQWRLGSVSLTVISCESQPSLPEDRVHRYTGFQYDFQIDDMLLGEGSDLPMLELRPSSVTELEGTDPINFISLNYDHLPVISKISNEESMREYSDLKFSLLFYDAILTFLGTSVAFLSAGEDAGIAFFVGGVGGFFYLLLLQRSVDELPASELISGNRGGTKEPFKGIKGPIASVALAAVVAVFAARYGSGDFQVTLTPKDIILGMMGFLACKVAVVLSAFKPIGPGLKLPSDM